MEHVVFYTGAEGASASARFPSMPEGVAFIERLRNVEGVADAVLYALSPVPLKVTTYYRVEVPAEIPAVEAASDGAVLETGPVDVPLPDVDEPVAAGTVDAAGRRSLGFFGH